MNDFLIATAVMTGEYPSESMMADQSEKDIAQRLDALCNEHCTHDLISDLFGFDLRSDTTLANRYTAWAKQHYRRDVQPITDEHVNRWALETFLQTSKQLPTRLAAADLGMTEASFIEVMEKLVDNDLIDWSLDKKIIAEHHIRDFHRNFKELQWTVFGNIRDRCEKIHREIENELNIEVEPLFCVTSEFLNEEPVAFAQQFDALTDEPVSLRYQHWLKTDKPMHLTPDTCATLTLAKHENILKSRVFPGEPTEGVASVKEALTRGDRRG